LERGEELKGDYALVLSSNLIAGSKSVAFGIPWASIGKPKDVNYGG